MGPGIPQCDLTADFSVRMDHGTQAVRFAQVGQLDPNGRDSVVKPWTAVLLMVNSWPA